MDTYALFDDLTSNRLVYSFYDSEPGHRIKINFPPSLSDPQVRNSADEGVHCAYRILRDLSYIGAREDYYLRCRFEDYDVNMRTLGASAGLTFSLKFAQEIYRIKSGKSLGYSIAATGVIEENGCGVSRVRRINAKMDAAFATLRFGDFVFYPLDNEKDVDPSKREYAKQRGIELIPVSGIKDAICKLFSEDDLVLVGSSADIRRMLSAIMFTDIVGYSALMQENESQALEILDEHRKILRPIFLKCNGTEIETAGDSFFVEFHSVLEAARCAFEIQKNLFQRNIDAPVKRRIQIRIGLHVSDVVHTGSNVHGNGVNIANRIESLAKPGGVCLSEDVARQIRKKFEIPLKKLGKRELKNIKLPMNIYKMIMPWDPSLPFYDRLYFKLEQRNTRRTIGVLMVILIVIGYLIKSNYSAHKIILPSPCETKEFIYRKQYENAQKKYLEYLENKQRFENIELFLNNINGIKIPITFSRLYIDNQPEFASIAKALRRGKTYPDGFDKIVLIAGGPGIGKSTFLKWMATPSEGPENAISMGKIAIIDLGKSFRAENRRDDPECWQDPKPSYGSTLEDNLVIDGVCISRLPKIDNALFNPKRNATEVLYRFLSEYGFHIDIDGKEKRIGKELNFTAIIVDSIDEVAPTSSKNFLELLRKFKSENPAVTVVAAGRGEGFRDYVLKNVGSYEYHHMEPIYLGTDRLIEWRIHGYLIWHLIESEESSEIPRSKISQKDLASVAYGEKVAELKRRLYIALDEEPWLRNFLFLLEPSNKLFSNIVFLNPSSAAKDIRETWIASYLRRSCQTHNRPNSLSETALLDLYKTALQQAARKALVEFGSTPPGISKIGFKTPSFVLSLDNVGIQRNGETCAKVITIRLLERSGFVDILPIDSEHYNVMFFPPAAQEILADF